MSTFFNPVFVAFDLFGGERAVVVGWRHDDVRIARSKALDELALERLGRPDRTLRESFLALVETKPRLACLFVWAVALETVFREYRSNFLLEIDGVFRLSHDCERQGGHLGDSREASTRYYIPSAFVNVKAGCCKAIPTPPGGLPP